MERLKMEQGSEMARWESGRFLFLFKGGGQRVSLRFHLFFLMLINEMKEQDRFKIFLRGCRDGKTVLRFNASCERYGGV